MNKTIKIFVITFTILVLGYVVYTTTSQILFNNLLRHMNFLNIVAFAAGGFVITYLTIRFFKYIWNVLLLIVLAISIQSCQYAKSNQQVVVSEDCGESWSLIKAGDAVPRAGVNMCYMKVVMPNYPMQGDMRFIANLRHKVKVNTEIDYDYQITQPLSFIKQAKFLGKANQDADSEDALNNKAFETAENSVIDKRIKDVAKRIFEDVDIIEVDLSDLESILLTDINKTLEPLGIQLNFLTLTFIPDEQTRQAIDIATAMRIYNANQLGDIGKTVMAARAGATKITVETKSETHKED